MAISGGPAFAGDCEGEDDDESSQKLCDERACPSGGRTVIRFSRMSGVQLEVCLFNFIYVSHGRFIK